MPRAKVAHLRPCLRCGKPFKPYQPKQQRYCGRPCRQAAYRERKKCPHCGEFINPSPKYRRTAPVEPVEK
jgi:hypothetical protein